jgi:hypothetical protein
MIESEKKRRTKLLQEVTVTASKRHIYPGNLGLIFSPMPGFEIESNFRILLNEQKISQNERTPGLVARGTSVAGDSVLLTYEALSYSLYPVSDC